MIRKSVRFFLNSLLPLFSQKAYLLYLLKSLKRTTTNEKTNYYFFTNNEKNLTDYFYFHYFHKTLTYFTFLKLKKENN